MVTVSTPHKVEPNNSHIIFANEWDEPQALQFTAAVAMQVQYGVFGFDILLLEYDG